MNTVRVVAWSVIFSLKIARIAKWFVLPTAKAQRSCLIEKEIRGSRMLSRQQNT
jgi:hypothetical protein